MKYPFSDASRDSTVIYRVMNGQRPSRPASDMKDDSLWGLVEDCWQQHPSHRPGMEVVSERMIQLSSEECFEENT